MAKMKIITNVRSNFEVDILMVSKESKCATDGKKM